MIKFTRTRPSATLLACAGALIAYSMTGGDYSYAQSEVYGTMMVVKGDIKVNSTKSGKVESAKVGFKVYAGDAIQSGPDSRAKIIMSDKNVINVSPDSKVTIAKYENNPAKDSRNVELKVDYGKVRASVEQQYDGEKNKFNVRTPTAVAGVRGTDFMAGYNPTTRKTTVVTFKGLVAVGIAGANGAITKAVFVRPGQSADVDETQKVEPPKTVPTNQLNDANQESSADTAKGGANETAPTANNTAPAKDQEPKKDEAKPDGSQPANADQAKAEPKKEVAPAPAGGDTAKKDAPASGTGSTPNATGSTPSGSASNSTSTTTPARTTASVPPVSMISSRDLDTSISREIKVAPELPKVPTTYKPPTANPVVAPTPNPFVDNAIRNQKSRVRVEICLPGTGC